MVDIDCQGNNLYDNLDIVIDKNRKKLRDAFDS